MAGIYIHIPFCKQACAYCDFHFSTNLKSKSDLVSAILKEIDTRKEYLIAENIETIYFGGGTPSLLSPTELSDILEKVHSVFNITSNAEITLEGNPDDLSIHKLNELKQLGINRLSIGLQSFNDEELKWMNRAHSAHESINSVKLAQDAGFKNITIDLIYGSKFQDLSSWQKTLETALLLNVQHISAYNLTIEAKTKLGVNHSHKTEPAINEELSAQQFVVMIETLKKNNFIHYEISNFGKEGCFSKHNTNYWLGSDYLGLGPSAHSFNGTSRQWNVASNAGYMSAVNLNKPYYEIELLGEKEKHNEYILTRLRTMWGCDINEIQLLFGLQHANNFTQTAKKYIQFFEDETSVYKLNLEGKLRADFLASEFFV